MSAGDLDLIERLGAFETPAGGERMSKIALIAAAAQVPASRLPIDGIRRWRECLDDVAETTGGARRGGWRARRALGRSVRRLRAAEAELDGCLDRTIRAYGLGGRNGAT